jgi:hypothetical protein
MATLVGQGVRRQDEVTAECVAASATQSADDVDVERHSAHLGASPQMNERVRGKPAASSSLTECEGGGFRQQRGQAPRGRVTSLSIETFRDPETISLL